jgi:RimJ/RimL family protein N-acetyltransferase
MVRGWDGGHPQPAYGYFTDRRWHRRGVATAMTGLVLAELHNRGVPEVRARVHVDNVASLRTLRHAGFVDHAVEHGRVVLRAVPGPGR